MLKRKKSENNLERYEKGNNGVDNNFLDKYINKNTVAHSKDPERFPSIEARKKYQNEYSPKLVDSK